MAAIANGPLTDVERSDEIDINDELVPIFVDERAPGKHVFFYFIKYCLRISLNVFYKMA